MLEFLHLALTDQDWPPHSAIILVMVGKRYIPIRQSIEELVRHIALICEISERVGSGYRTGELITWWV
ncbi:hypothetical protein BABINDRAFT_160900 [Babjeviella inositovora NRRL Y-12698]|uniref:Uncharacterized protein n=1 Tax=Babjeviella inositovora NRRL Y-12698 TaxID=984486 RepID=A0A1E3QSH2_9ASCO|nr:uncharacterized protein BABINDRAFT_160900 [Babjeviella inositovora NRRL Y-12698]ODQ80653.1 hypothetical protein BABINDRAFT_160900 [Babjeviella inositovora NRRL Y-12698]